MVAVSELASAQRADLLGVMRDVHGDASEAEFDWFFAGNPAGGGCSRRRRTAAGPRACSR